MCSLSFVSTTILIKWAITSHKRAYHFWYSDGDIIPEFECGIWYHHPRRLQCVLSRNLRIFKVATCQYRSRHNLKNNCIWDTFQCCLLVPKSPSKPVMLTFDLQYRKKCYFIETVFGMYNLERQLWYWHLLTRHCPCNLLPEPTFSKHGYREKLWGHLVTSSMTSSQWKYFSYLWSDWSCV